MSMQSAENKKKELRHWFREQRSALSSQTRDNAANEIASRIISIPEYQRARHIGVYHAMREEISLAPLIRQARQDHKFLYLPVVSGAGQEKRLHFRPWQENTELTINHHGIAQPAINAGVDTEPDLELVLLPLVAFDSKGQRLGMGGGYYDRYFSRHSRISNDASSHTKENLETRIGIAHSCQLAHQIPCEDWDIALHAVATEKEYMSFK